MTLRTTSAIRRRVVSRSREVASTSATSSSRGSICRCCAGLERTEPIVSMIAAEFARQGTLPAPCLSLPLAAARGPCCAVFLLPTLFSRHHAYIGQVAIAFSVIQPIADDKFIGNFEAYVI